MPMGFFPRPTDSWPLPAVVAYWFVIGVLFAAALIKTIMKSYAHVPQGSVGMRMRLEKPIRVNPQKKDEACLICDARRIAGCDDCAAHRYCATCPECPVHDELKLANPGLRWQIPFTHSMREQSLQDQPLELARTPFEKDGRKREVDGTVTYHVPRDSRSIFRALFRSSDLEKSISALATQSMGVAALASSSFDVAEIGEYAVRHLNGLPGAGEKPVVRKVCAADYGVRALTFTVKPVSRADSQVVNDGMSASQLFNKSVESAQED